MEYKFSQEFVQTLLRDYSRAMVGRLCKQVELLSAKSDLSEKQKLDLLKSFNRELIYEHFRDLENQLKAYTEGRKFTKFEIYTTPSSDSQKSA